VTPPPLAGLSILLISTYELGHQPLGLAAPAAALRAAGHHVTCRDLGVEPFAADWLREAGLVAISVPMHTAARLGVEVARRVRQLSPAAHVAFYGLYATPLGEMLLKSGLADSVIGGEYEPGLVALARSLSMGGAAGQERHTFNATSFERQQYAVPDRGGLPPLELYAHLKVDGELRLAGYVEASRGCAHACTHCPITPVYGGRLRLVQRETVLADIDQQVLMGARHITFGDPDFLNAVPHSWAIIEELQRRHPGITFDVTVKVEHLVEHAALLPRLRDAGCLFITSAFESTNDRILSRLQKGHTLADMEWVLALAEREDLVLRPTWVAFTPWTSADDYLDMLAFVDAHGLVDHVQPVQYALRLLLPPGSPLVPVLEGEGRLGRFDEEALSYAWSNQDPRMDELQAEIARVVGAAHDCGGTGSATLATIRDTAYRLLRGQAPPASPARRAKGVPGLTESWFC
jgi:radical SAM superfamily enzyme YgiQ (UPF0313 family)